MEAARMRTACERQSGLFTLTQAAALRGVAGRPSSAGWRVAATSARTQASSPSPARPSPGSRSLLAACLAAGKCGRVAPCSRPDLGASSNRATTSSRSRSLATRSPGAEVRRSTARRTWSSVHTTVRRRIPVTNPLRTIVDLGAVLPRGVRSRTRSIRAWPGRRCSPWRPSSAMRDKLGRTGAQRGGGAAQGSGGAGSGRCGQRLHARASDGAATAAGGSAGGGVPLRRFTRRRGCSWPRSTSPIPEVRLAIEVDGFKVAWHAEGDGEGLRAAERARAVWVARAAVHVAAGRLVSRRWWLAASPTRWPGSLRRSLDAAWIGRPASSRARKKIWSSIGSVSLPVKVFCWLGWNEHRTVGPPVATSTPWPKRGRGAGRSTPARAGSARRLRRRSCRGRR